MWILNIFKDLIDKTNRMEEAKNDVQRQVDATNKRIAAEEDNIASIEQSGNFKEFNFRPWYIYEKKIMSLTLHIFS